MKSIFSTILSLIIIMTAESSFADGDNCKLLAVHETVAIFEGVSFRKCMGMTSRCPKECGHSGEFATFTIKEYLKYEKTGEYGDPKQESYLIQVSDYYKKLVGDPEIAAKIESFEEGDEVYLNWKHEYVTKNNASYPVRTVTLLEKKDSEAP